MMLCGWHRKRISRSIEAGQAPTSATSRHLAQCAACEAYHRSLQEVQRRLGEEAPSLPDVSGELHARILLRCGLAEQAGSEASHKRVSASAIGASRWRVVRMGLAAAVVIAAVAAGVLWPEPPTRANGGGSEALFAVIGDPAGVVTESVRAATEAVERRSREADDSLEGLAAEGLAVAESLLAYVPVDIRVEAITRTQ